MVATGHGKLTLAQNRESEVISVALKSRAHDAMALGSKPYFWLCERRMSPTRSKHKREEASAEY
jgi:hypothetical protein